jgi:hypothetical protein
MRIELSERELSLLLTVLSEVDLSAVFAPEPDDGEVFESIWDKLHGKEGNSALAREAAGFV